MRPPRPILQLRSTLAARPAAFLPSPLTTCLRVVRQPPRSQSRPFMSSFLPNSSPPSPRTLSASRVVPYPAQPCFKAVCDVDSYDRFLPFITESTVLEKDKKGYPISATLTAGYGPTKGSYRSKVECDERQMKVTARSGRGVDWAEDGSGDDENEGLFEFLDTIWKFAPQEGQQTATKVDLVVKFQLRSAVLSALMKTVEGEVANMMIEAFEKRMKEDLKSEPKKQAIFDRV